MPVRLVALFALFVAGVWFASCSSGLGNDPRRRDDAAAAAAANTNLPLGLDLGVVPTADVTEPAIAGLVVPAIGATPARELLLVAFTTAASAADADGAGTPLARDATTDGNGADDVFVAVVDEAAVERRAFSQSLAGKFRHPRCATCHSMAATDTQAFASSLQAHAGPPPGDGFPFRQPEVCAPCHVTSNTFPVEGWQAPAASFDMRPKTVAQLMQMAQNVPADETEHFVTDKRVLWALDSGILPQVGGRNGIADDDHDGVLETEDNDGTPRTVPGGSVEFLHEIEQWRASGMVATTAAAVRDVTLVSRATGTTAAGNGASSAPSVKWVPNPSFDPGNAAATNPIGTLYVAFQSTAGDLVAGDGNGVMDVFRAAVELHAEQDATGGAAVGGLNLVAVDATELCSAETLSDTEGDAASSRPAIGGADAEFVAFESLATNLVPGFADGNGAGSPDVFLRTIGAALPATTTQLVSNVVATPAAGGNGASERPAVAAGGGAVAWESDATDLVNGDGNGQRDVFVAPTAGGAPFVVTRASVTANGLEAAGGPSRRASVHASGSRMRVAFESDAADLDPAATAATNVFLFDSASGGTTLLNQRVSPGTAVAGDGPARAPQLLPDGSAVAFESEAQNLDVLRPDGNPAADVFVVETQQLESGRVLPFRISTTVANAADGNGASTGVVVGSFLGASATYPTGFAAYRTAATNLGTSDSTDVMLVFLAESSGILADFSATPTTGQAPLAVQFTDASTGSPNAWAWDFDNDGTVDSNLQNPTRVFAAPGDFTVKLVASNRNAEGETVEAAFVHVTGTITADFSAQPTTTGGSPLTVLFRDASSEQNGTIGGWAWDFDGDGTTDSTQANPSHTFTTQGTFAVTLTVTAENGTATTTKAGFVTVQAPGSIVGGFTSTVASSPVGGRNGTAVGSVWDDETIQFTDTSTGGANAWLWDFGDGTTSTLQNPTHVFATPGSYDVVLQVSGPGGTDFEVKPQLIRSIGGATSVTLDAAADNTIYSTNQVGPPAVVHTSNNYGAGGNMVAGNTISRGPRRALIRFNLADAIDTGSVVTAAVLQLTNTSPSAVGQLTGTQTFAIRRVTSAWNEGTNASGSAGQGSLVVGNGSTWLHRIASTTAWTTPGGDTAAPSGTIQITDAYQAFDSSNLATDVQGWVNAPTTNFGWQLRGDEVGTKTIKWFATHENADPAKRPRLVVTFRPPLP
ncbi:MAG: PKD domain-containing protein [Planctomycetes bacterium]|nr:PKD domain-containing protein [Planctomycetota bacterium]